MDWSDLLAVQPWHKPNRTGENGMACFKAKQKQTDGFLRQVSGPQLFWLLEADGTQDWGGWWAGASSPPSCVGFKNRAEGAFCVWTDKIPSPASLY